MFLIRVGYASLSEIARRIRDMTLIDLLNLAGLIVSASFLCYMITMIIMNNMDKKNRTINFKEENSKKTDIYYRNYRKRVIQMRYTRKRLA